MARRKARAGSGRKPARAARTGRVTFETARRIALALPGVEDAISYGTPSLKVRGRFMARIKEDGETLALRVDFAVREALMQEQPEVFYVTDHYLNYPAVLVRLPKVSRAKLRQVLEHAHRVVAPKRGSE
jgi:hypothetical protein